jgi:hypothetical protein
VVFAHFGESSSAYRPTFCSLSDSEPTESSFFDSVDPLLHEPHARQDEDRELQVLRLPVLHHRPAERRRRHVAPQRQRLRLLVEQFGVGDLLVVVERVARDRLGHEQNEEQHEEEQGQPVVAQEPHARSVMREADGRERHEPGRDQHDVDDEHGAHRLCGKLPTDAADIHAGVQATARWPIGGVPEPRLWAGR